MINAYVNEFSAKYSPDYQGGMTNHLPMAQVALYQLTEDMDSVELFTNYYAHHTKLELVEPTDLVITYIEQSLGQSEAYPAYVQFFDDWVAMAGIEVVLTEALKILSKGLLGRAFHCLIKLAYGLDVNNHDEIIRGLAYFASAYLALPEAHRSVPLKDLEETLDAVAGNRYFNERPLVEGLFTDVLGDILKDQEFQSMNFHVEGDSGDVYKHMVTYAVEDYLHTGSFLELHTLTALHAIAVLSPYVEDLSSLMDPYVTAYISGLLSIKNRTKEIQPDRYELDSWDTAFSYVLSTSDAHSIKFMYSCYQLHRFTGNDQLLQALSIRLTQDQTI